uniref:ST8 alpha-N-acetyl-neuraminide alpha-2,8-sialyltransferase 6 n=1 Tax=Oryzias sinensis TaxID=183150 RepID=A0A8C7WWZ5_9TELE
MLTAVVKPHKQLLTMSYRRIIDERITQLKMKNKNGNSLLLDHLLWSNIHFSLGFCSNSCKGAFENRKKHKFSSERLFPLSLDSISLFQSECLRCFRSQLNSKCHGLEKAIITQANTPQGTKLVYDADRKRTLVVNAEVFNTFIKENPFPNKTWDSCAVVGNGGILANSSCGKTIDSAQFVIRCNLPPLSNGFEKDVGIKSDIVTANPSIITEKFFSLMRRRRPFAEAMRIYGNSMVLLPAFSFGQNTPLSVRAFYTLEDFESSARAVYFNPEYLRNLANFWRSEGLKSPRLSTGIMMASIALEVCSEVHLYGFWPFDVHPYSHQALTNHYYDDRKAKNKFHAMPTEFNLLLQLHRKGVLRLHLGDCTPDEK